MARKPAYEELEGRIKELEKETAMYERAKEALRESEEKWRSLVENAPDIILTVDQDERILYINNPPVGLTAEEALGTNVVDYVAPEYHEKVRQSLKRVFQTGNPDHYEIAARGPYDITSWYSTRLSPIRHNDDVVAVVLVTRDITERKRAEEDSELFRNLIDESNDAIFVIEPETSRFFDVNDKSCSSLGYKREELLNMGVVDIEAVIPDDFSWEKHVKEVRKSGYVILEGGHRRKDGTTFPVEVNVKIITQKGKEYMIAVARDITERKQYEEVREKLVEELHDALVKVKTLSGLLPICASCKKIRDDKGNWDHIETYIGDHSEADFSHGICPECSRKLYPELQDD